jgi:hypothetical protein
MLYRLNSLQETMSVYCTYDLLYNYKNLIISISKYELCSLFINSDADSRLSVVPVAPFSAGGLKIQIQ